MSSLKWYFIETSNGLVLNLTDDGIILGWRSQVDSKMWRLDENGVIHSKTGSVIEIPGSNTDQGVALMGCHDGHGGENQRFTFDGSAIRSHLNQFVFDVEEGLMEVGSALCVWPHQGGDNQTFKFVQVSTRRRARNLRASSDNVEVKIVKTSEGIPEGWYQANLREAAAYKEVIRNQMGKWAIAEVVGGWIKGRGYEGGIIEWTAKTEEAFDDRQAMQEKAQTAQTVGEVLSFIPGLNLIGMAGSGIPNGVGYGLEGVTEANGSPGALEKRVILKHKAQAMDSSQETDWEGLEITKKEMKNVTLVIQVFGAGRIHHMKRVAKITKETFEDIKKRVEDRRKESSNRNVFLMNELGQAKIRGKELKEKLGDRTKELKRQSDTLKRLKRELEHSKTQLRNQKKNLKKQKEQMERQQKAKAEAEKVSTAATILSFIPFVAPIGWALKGGAEIAKQVIAGDIEATQAVVNSLQPLVESQEKDKNKMQADKDSQRNEVQELHRVLDQLRRERLATKDKILATDTENRRCTALGLEIKAAEVKVIEMYNAANNTSTRAEKAFDMEQMAIPLNELLVSLENNIDVLDEGAKAEILLTRFKFQKFKRALEAKGGDAADEF